MGARTERGRVESKMTGRFPSGRAKYAAGAKNTDGGTADRQIASSIHFFSAGCVELQDKTFFFCLLELHLIEFHWHNSQNGLLKLSNLLIDVEVDHRGCDGRANQCAGKRTIDE